VGSLHEFVAVDHDEIRVEAVTQPSGVANDRIEDELDIAWRAGDHLQDLARRSLLVSGFEQFASEIRIPRP
jgi:hypothetical protein